MVSKKMEDDLYKAFEARDTGVDGRFFVGVSSTGIYCRPVCTAKMPKRENCTFFTSAAEAEQAGYRPCMICRPELAPGVPRGTAQTLAQKAAGLLEENCGSELDPEHLTERLGCSEEYLDEEFRSEYHVTPAQYLQTCRLLLAKELLTDTDLSLQETAAAAGLGSAGRMSELFQQNYKLVPEALRRRRPAGGKCPGSVTVMLGYRPPYEWEEMLGFLSGRAIRGVEKVEDGRYSRTVRISDRGGRNHSGWISISRHPGKDALDVTVSDTLLPVISKVLYRTKHLFDLRCDPDEVYEALKVMDELEPGLCLKGRRLPGCFDPFETAVRAILGQQITVKAASTLAGRVAEELGTPVDSGIDGLKWTFPAPSEIAAMGDSTQERLGTLGVIAARSACIRDLAEAIEKGEIRLDLTADPEREMKKMRSIRGIGGWTAQYVAMRTMGWPDAFLETDAGVKHALPGRSPKELLALAERWRPWRSYAVVNLWNGAKK